MGLDGVPVPVAKLAAEQTQQLSLLESSHVYFILKATLERLALVGLIRVDPQQQAQELTQSVGEEITRMIQVQGDLERQFEELISAQHVLRTLPNKQKLRDNQADLRKVADALRQSTKQLCRNLKENPNVAQNMQKVASERQSLQMLLSQCLSELEGIQSVPSMMEAVLGQEMRHEERRETIERERIATTTVRQLHTELRDEKADHETKMCNKRRELALLKEELKQLKAKTSIESSFSEADKTAHNEHQRRLQITELQLMEQELDLLQQLIQMESVVHDTTAEHLQKRQQQFQEQQQQWRQKATEDVNLKEQYIEALKADHRRDLTRLQEVESRHNFELAKKAERDNQKKEAAEREIAERVQQEQQGRAAVRIQAMWRGFKTRQDMKGGKGKGGKGKGGKGKKGKK